VRIGRSSFRAGVGMSPTRLPGTPVHTVARRARSSTADATLSASSHSRNQRPAAVSASTAAVGPRRRAAPHSSRRVDPAHAIAAVPPPAARRRWSAARGAPRRSLRRRGRTSAGRRRRRQDGQRRQHADPWAHRSVNPDAPRGAPSAVSAMTRTRPAPRLRGTAQADHERPGGTAMSHHGQLLRTTRIACGLAATGGAITPAASASIVEYPRDPSATAIARAMAVDPTVVRRAVFPPCRRRAPTPRPCRRPGCGISAQRPQLRDPDERQRAPCGRPRHLGSSGSTAGGPSVRGARDVTIMRIDLRIPRHANCLSFRFRFLSEEFAEFVDSPYSDAFIAELGASSWSASKKRAPSITRPGTSP
jgi:hypothetical protein